MLTSRGERRFRNDVRYDLQNVADGWSCRVDHSDEDASLLERICAAYIKATEQQSLVKEAYRAAGWWQSVRKSSLAPVQGALASRDTKALRAMYRNFFRDPCSAGLIAGPFHEVGTDSRKADSDSYRRFYLSNALHRIDYWKEQTKNRFDLSHLAGPTTGNPFGVAIEGTLVRTGTEYQHYCATRICDLVPAQRGVVVEIGGGFGSMAYYLLRDRPKTTYIDFDVPESIALASYYLLKSLPDLRFLLYGEEDLSEESLSKFDIILMPAFELRRVPAKSVDLSFSSYAMSSFSRQATVEYMDEIVRITRRLILHICSGTKSIPFQKLIRLNYPSLVIVEKRSLEWNRQQFLNSDEGGVPVSGGFRIILAKPVRLPRNNAGYPVRVVEGCRFVVSLFRVQHVTLIIFRRRELHMDVVTAIPILRMSYASRNGGSYPII